RFSTKLKCFAYNVSGFASEPHIYCFIQGILLDVNCHPLPPGRPGCAPKLVRFPKWRTCMRVYPVCELIAHRSVRNSFRELARVAAVIAMASLPLSGSAEAQVNVVTYHNDNARTGVNANETVLTPSNVKRIILGNYLRRVSMGSWWGSPCTCRIFPYRAAAKHITWSMW